MNERAINLCTTTNDIRDMYFINHKTIVLNDDLINNIRDMYFIDHKEIVLNDDLNQSLFLRRGKIHINRKVLRKLTIEFINDIRVKDYNIKQLLMSKKGLWLIIPG